MGCSCRGIFRFMSMRALEGAIAVLILLFIPNLPPHCKIEKPYKVAPTRPFEGGLALNDKLNNAELWHEGDFKGPEAFAIYNDELYTSLQSGEIVKLTGKDHITPVVQFGKPCKNEFDERLCGRPLGMVFDKNGYLYAADAYYGIFKVNVKTGDKEQLVSPDKEINGKKPMLFNSLAITSSGDIYWTDSSTEFLLENGMFDLFADGSGRLIHYNAKTKQNREILSDLHFANGVLISKDEDYLLVSETARSRIHRYYLKGPKAGTSDIFVDGLPGLPDNLSHDGQGGYFVPLVSSHDAAHPSAFQIFGPFPLARKFLNRVMGVMEWIFSTIDRVYPNDFARTGVYFIGHFSTGHIFAFSSRSTIVRVDGNGVIIGSFHSTNERVHTISEAIIYKDHLLIGSPFRDSIGRVPLKDIGLKASSPEATREKREVPVVKEAPKPQTTKAPTTKAPPTQAPKATVPPKPQTPPPTQAPKPQTTTKAPTQAPKTQTPPPQPKTPPPTEAPKPKTQPPTEAPKPKTPTKAPVPKTTPPTQAPKPKTPPPTEAPKPKTPPPTQAPKPKTPPPTEAPKLKTPPPTQAPKPQPTTKPNTQAPKTQTTTKTPTQATKTPTQAPKPQTPPPTQAPKQQKPSSTVKATETPSKQSSQAKQQAEKIKT